MPARTVNNLGGSAGRKRSHRDPEDDSGEEGVSEVRQASSSLQSEARRKRARISKGKQPARHRAARESTESSGDDDEDVDMQAHVHDDAPQATQYEIMRDAGFEDLQNPEQDDEKARKFAEHMSTQRQSNRAGEVGNHAADNGIIESILCINFMCHQKLFVELGPNLNFIVGENGSGKSAILTAITLCLGGKASSTNRGGSLKAFIKEGTNEARVQVKIKNQGSDAYLPDLYGESITVERRFKINGTGGFRTISAAGHEVSKKRTEVDDISEYYCLQVDNPLNVLSQDNARQFLNQATAKQKYKFFLQGVQLQQLDDDYRAIGDMLSSCEDKESDLQTKLETCEQEHAKAQKNYALFMEGSAMRQQRQLLRQKIAWAQVVDVERKVAEYKEKRPEADLVIEQAQEEVTIKTRDLEDQDTRITQAEEEVQAIKEGRGALEADVEEASRKFEQARSDLQKLNHEEREAHSSLSNASRDIKDNNQKIKDEEQRLQEMHGAAHTAKLQALDDARAKLQQIENESDEARKRLPALNAETDEATKQLGTAGTFITQKQTEIKGIQKRVRDLEQGQGSLYDGYEPQMKNLLKMIEGDGGFERKPVGPIGAHIQVSKPVWSPMLEKMFGEALNGFVVTSKHDQQRLKSMMNRSHVKRSLIYIGNPRPIDTRSNEPDQNFDTVLRILKVDDPLVRNQLIINHRIEKTVLIEGQQHAEDVMIKSSPPPNVSACYHLFPKKGRGWTVRIQANANGANSAPQAPPPAHQPPRLKSDSLQETSLHKEQLGQLQNELRELHDGKHTQQQTVERCRAEVQNIKQTVDKNKQRARQAQVDINDIKGQLDSYEGADSRLEGLREELQKAQEAVAHFGAQYGDLTLKKQQQGSVCEELRDEVKREKSRLREYETRLSKAENKVQRYQSSREIVVVAKNEAHDKHQVAVNEKERLRHKIERTEEELRIMVTGASSVCPRVHIAEDETYATVEKKLNSVCRALDGREKRRGATDDEIIQKKEAAKKNLITLQSNVNGVCGLNKVLRKSLNKRLDKWRIFRRFISANSRNNFKQLLRERQFRGNLILDHENRALEVQVEPDATRKDAAARNTKTLSGGEKSFSSICLLLAIWEAMGSPIRCLDEFDVFMDNVNRAISTEMLCAAARNSVGRQFILITPNAIEGRARLSKDVKITRMTDPRQRRIEDMM